MGMFCGKPFVSLHLRQYFFRAEVQMPQPIQLPGRLHMNCHISETAKTAR